jgi:Spy/CpxP family protein refolding chaperone
MKKLIPIIVALFILMPAVYAQEFRGPEGREHGHQQKMAQKMRFEMLDLSEEQREEIHTLRISTKKKIIPLKADIELKRIDLENEMRVDQPNRNKVMKLIKEISDLELKIKQTQVDQKLKINSILTSEQREQLKRPMRKVIKKKIIKQDVEIED